MFLTDYTPSSLHTQILLVTKHQPLQKTIIDFTCTCPPANTWAPGAFFSSHPTGAPLPLCPHHSHEQPTPDLQHGHTFLRPKLRFRGQSSTFLSISSEMLTKSLSALFRAITFLPPSTACVTPYLTLDILLYKEHFKIIGKSHQRDYFCLLNNWFSEG